MERIGLDLENEVLSKNVEEIERKGFIGRGQQATRKEERVTVKSAIMKKKF